MLNPDISHFLSKGLINTGLQPSEKVPWSGELFQQLVGAGQTVETVLIPKRVGPPG